MEPQAAVSQGYGVALMQTLAALAGVCVLAWWVLRWGARGALRGAGSGRIEVLERAALDARRAVYVVRVGERVLVLGAGDGALTLLTEMKEGELPALPRREAAAGWRESLDRLLGRARPDPAAGDDA